MAMKPEFPIYEDTWTDSDGITMEWLPPGQWVKQSTHAHYNKKRAHNYPTLGEQLDLIYHDLADSGQLTTNGQFYKARANIKTLYPKIEDSSS
tara:strand:+ start:220 stop:498 length:279 start_codon:yes stop_codon:yes gene_type:complete